MAFDALFSGTGIFILAAVVVGIWVIIEIRRFRHKIFAIFLIILIVLSYWSFFAVFKNQELELNTVSGIVSATKIYFLWLLSIYDNFKSLTMNIISMDWTQNFTTTNNKI